MEGKRLGGAWWGYGGLVFHWGFLSVLGRFTGFLEGFGGLVEFVS